jgi:hypothetical protein
LYLADLARFSAHPIKAARLPGGNQESQKRIARRSGSFSDPSGSPIPSRFIKCNPGARYLAATAGITFSAAAMSINAPS